MGKSKIPNTKPPIWAHQAIPPKFWGKRRLNMPLKNWLKNQSPMKRKAGISTKKGIRKIGTSVIILEVGKRTI
jgi:hypothetical protein